VSDGGDNVLFSWVPEEWRELETHAGLENVRTGQRVGYADYCQIFAPYERTLPAERQERIAIIRAALREAAAMKSIRSLVGEICIAVRLEDEPDTAFEVVPMLQRALERLKGPSE
jgi:hypothetical protein